MDLHARYQQTLKEQGYSADEAQIRAIVPQAQFGQLVGCGHFPNIEQPAQLNAMLETFIAQL